MHILIIYLKSASWLKHSESALTMHGGWNIDRSREDVRVGAGETVVAQEYMQGLNKVRSKHLHR
jgi:hypothetical protein